VKVIASYIAEVEQAVMPNQRFGWETRLAENKWSSYIYGSLSMLLYLTLTLISAVIAVRATTMQPIGP
jgi:hypothetical protein